MVRGKSQGKAQGQGAPVTPVEETPTYTGTCEVLGSGEMMVGGEDNRRLVYRRGMAGQRSVQSMMVVVPPGGPFHVDQTGYALGHAEPIALPCYLTIEEPTEWEPRTIVTLWATLPGGPACQWAHDAAFQGQGPSGMGLELVRLAKA